MGEDNLAVLGPKYNRVNSQPEFSETAKQVLPPSDPVDPRDLRQRLETWLLEEEKRKKYKLPRTMKKVQTSNNTSPISFRSHSSSSSSSASTPGPSQTPFSLTYSQDTFARSLKFHKLQDQLDGAPKRQEYAQKKSKSIPIARITHSPVAVDHSIQAALDVLSQSDKQPTSKDAKSKPCQLPKAPPTPPKIQASSLGPQQRPKSLPYMPRYAERSMVLTATPDRVKRESVHVLSQQVLDAYQRLSVLHAVDHPSPFDSSFAESSVSSLAPQTILCLSDSSKLTDTSQTDNSNIDRNSPPANAGGNRVPPAVHRQESSKRRPKTWTPRNVVNAIKARNEAQETLMGRNNFQATKVMIEAAEHDRARTAPFKQIVSPHEAAARCKEHAVDGLATRGRPKRKTTAFENFMMAGDAKNNYRDKLLKPMGEIPVIVEPGERRPGARDWAQESSDEEAKPSLYSRVSRRVSRRRTTGDGGDESNVQTVRTELRQKERKEELRAKQLAMRQKAVEASRGTKNPTRDWEQLSSQRKLTVNATSLPQPQPTAPKDRPIEKSKSQSTGLPARAFQLPTPEPTPTLTHSDKYFALAEPLPSLSVPIKSLPKSDIQPGYGLSESTPPIGGERRVEISPKFHFYKQPQKSTGTLDVHAGPPPLHPILSTQTEPLPPRHPPNNIATLPSQVLAASRNHSATSLLLTPGPGLTCMHTTDPENAKRFHERRNTRIAAGSDDIVTAVHKRSSGFTTPETPHSKAYGILQAVDIEKPTRSPVSTVQNFSQRTRSWAPPVPGNQDKNRDVVAASYSPPRPSSKDGSVKSVQRVNSGGPLVGLPFVPKVQAFELDQMTPESIELLREQEKKLQRLTAASVVVEIPVISGTDVRFGLPMEHCGTGSAHATPAGETPIHSETSERTGKKSVAEDRRRKRHTLIRAGCIFRGKSRRRDEREPVPDDYETGERVERESLRAIGRLMTGTGGVSMLDLGECGHNNGKMKKKSKWKFWRKVA